jgi:hypothetical protein
MSDGKLYKFNASTYSKSVAKKFNATSISDGKVRHANASTWYDNYPMEQEYTQNFNATWSQGWRGDGVRLDDTAWFGRVLTGSTTNYRGMYGFNKTAIENFIAGGTVTKARFHVHCRETTTNGSPDVKIGKHTYTSEPSGTWTGQNAYWTDYSTLHVPNQAIGGYWVDLKTSQIHVNGVVLGGIAMMGMSATAEDLGHFSGVTEFTTQLQITVLK